MPGKDFHLSYMPSFDGLRGIAILLVMAHHSPFPYARGGFIGVDIFFVLSGFLITSLLLKEFDQDGNVNFKDFYMRRILRLIPALIVLLAVLNIYIILTQPDGVLTTIRASLLALFYVSNWAYIFGHP